MNRTRQANFELLRIVAMMMIIALHYLVKGGVAVPYTENHSPVNYFAWLLEAFCIVAVNCYVLISGYFPVDASWKPRRVLSLVCQILFYSMAIPIVLIGLGIVSGSSLGVYDWIGYLFPVGTEHYWFGTAYLLMYLFSPLLAAGIRQMEQKQLQIVIGMLLLFFSLGKSVIPIAFVTDHYGYDFGWFLCLFVVAGYLRRFGFPWLEKRKHALLLYVLSAAGIWALSIVADGLSGKITAYTYYEDMPYTYNHILCLTGAVSLFYLFKNMEIRREKAGEVICKLSVYTFGIYLLHEHILLRYEWMQWLQVDRVAGTWAFIPHLLLAILLVYATGTIVDVVRVWLFTMIKELCGKKE